MERFFRTIREDLLQALPGYKGPDVHSRGVAPESEAFFYLDELEAIIREWVAVVYHHRPHESLLDPHLPSVKMSPAVMFEHGIARAGYIEVPRDPDLGYEFLKVEWRTLQHYGFEVHGRRYHGDLPLGCRDGASPYPDRGKGKGRWWPLHVDPDDITRLADALVQIKEKVRFCDVCGNVAEAEQCRICLDPRRDTRNPAIRNSAAVEMP